MSERRFGIALVGGTGFTGQRVEKYLLERHVSDGDAALRFAKDSAKVGGGISRPATSLAPALIDRLKQNAGLRSSLIPTR